MEGGDNMLLSTTKYITVHYKVFANRKKAELLVRKGYAFVSRVGFEGKPQNYILERSINLA